MSRKPLAALVLAALVTWSAPALAEDNAPGDDLENPNSCASPSGGGDVPPGSAVVIPPGGRVPSGFPFTPAGPGMASVFVCSGGHWVLLSVLSAAAAPLAADAPSVEIPEGTRASMTGTYASDGASLVLLTTSTGSVAPDDESAWSWFHVPDDGPTEQPIEVVATGGGQQTSTVFDLRVTNVAPTATSLDPSTTTALVGQPVTFAGTATDPSGADTAAGFTWSIDGGATQSFDTCGAHTVTGTATDKDGGASEPITSGAVQVLEAAYQAPLVAGARNLVRGGQVVPVKVSLGCAGATAAGLTPTISVLTGDADPATTADDPASLVPASDATGDTSGMMRQVGDSYLYNLKVPKAPTGSVFTVRVRPTSGSVMQVVLEVR